MRSRAQEAEIDWPAVVRRITCPVLLITGDSDKGAIVSPEQAEALRSLVPQVRIAHVLGAGHSVRREGFEFRQRGRRPPPPSRGIVKLAFHANVLGQPANITNRLTARPE